MKRYLLLAVVASMLSMPSLSDAACIKFGYVDRVMATPGAGANSVIYVRPSSISAFTYRVVTKDAKLIDAALAAVTSRTRVKIKGNAAACPAAGNIRNAGTLLFLDLAP